MKAPRPESASQDWDITFCIMTFKRTSWLRESLCSIPKHCPIQYRVKLMCVGNRSDELQQLLEELDDHRIELVAAPVNLPVGGGRKLLAHQVRSKLTMMMDDDLSLTASSIPLALKVLEQHEDIGAVSMPHYDRHGRMLSTGGRNLVIRDGVLKRVIPRLDFRANFMIVEDLDGSAMLYRTQMRNSFSWDGRYTCTFDDIDKSLSIVRDGRWKQAIVPNGQVIHDRSWLGATREYEKRRYNGIAMRRSYRMFRAKWRLRFGMREHLPLELIWPVLTLARWQSGIAILHRIIQIRTQKRISDLNSRSEHADSMTGEHGVTADVVGESSTHLPALSKS